MKYVKPQIQILKFDVITTSDPISPSNIVNKQKYDVEIYYSESVNKIVEYK